MAIQAILYVSYIVILLGLKTNYQTYKMIDYELLTLCRMKELGRFVCCGRLWILYVINNRCVPIHVANCMCCSLTVRVVSMSPHDYLSQLNSTTNYSTCLSLSSVYLNSTIN